MSPKSPAINSDVPPGLTRRPPHCSGFTIVEIIVAAAIMIYILLVLSSMTGLISRNWSTTKAKIEEFREAREGFESMTRTISQATLNTYLDFVDANGNTRFTYSSSANSTNFQPARYTRQSELRFLSGPNLVGNTSSSPSRPTHSIFFQAPLGLVTNATSYGGLENLLNTWGYYIEFNADTNRPSFLSMSSPRPRYRYRLMQLMEPSENLSLYNYTATNPALLSTDPNGTNWFGDPLSTGTNSRVLAENIIALVLLPQLSPGDTNSPTALAPSYTYDTTSNNAIAALNPKNQLPPLVMITMVAVDEPSYSRLQGSSTTPPSGLSSALTAFTSAGNLTNAASPGYAQDLQTLTQYLTSNHLAYRIFTTTVALKAAKWSRNQSN